MRAYSIEISNQKTGEPISTPTSGILNALGGGNGFATYTSLRNNVLGGESNPAALNIELDLPLFNWAAPKGGAALRIWGVGIAAISQAHDLNYHNIKIYGGMQTGLPLATAAASQYGLLVQGTIYQAYGNWIGTSQCLDLQIIPPQGPLDVPTNFTLDWPPNTPLAAALETMLKTAYPSYSQTIKISDKLTDGAQVPGYWRTFSEAAAAIRALSLAEQYKGIPMLDGGKPYTGVNMTIVGRNIVVYDGTKEYTNASFTNPTEIEFRDLIGQPTWLNFATLNFKTVLRADIKVGDYIEMPPQLATPFVLTGPGAAIPGSPSRNNSVFQGVFIVTDVHHFGNFRQADASSWVTSFDAVGVTVIEEKTQ